MPTAIDLSAIEQDKLYPPSEVAKLLGKSEKTLANKRTEKSGPAVTYVGKTPYYRGADLLKDIERGRVDFAAPVASAPRRQRRARAR